VVNFRGCTIVSNDNETLVVHVEDQILTLGGAQCLARLVIDGRLKTYHDGKADETNISTEGKACQYKGDGWHGQTYVAMFLGL
jgi:hypothetical protein